MIKQKYNLIYEFYSMYKIYAKHITHKDMDIFWLN